MAVTPFKSSDNFNMAGFNEKIAEADNTYVAKTGGSMSGALSMGGNKITDVGAPTVDGDAVNKGYVDGMSIIQTGSYVGDGKSGVSNKNSITFNFNPDLVFVQCKTTPSEGSTGGNTCNAFSIFTQGANRAFNLLLLNYNTWYGLILKWTDKKVEWYDPEENNFRQLNTNGSTYLWTAIGHKE